MNTKETQLLKRKLLDLATTNTKGYPFSACIVYNRKFYFAVNEVTYEKDPTAHAEIQVIRLACKEESRMGLLDK